VTHVSQIVELTSIEQLVREVEIQVPVVDFKNVDAHVVQVKPFEAATLQFDKDDRTHTPVDVTR
jgi:hypothetical protein